MCDYVLREEKIDIAEIMPGEWGPTTQRIYCKRKSTFWVQSLLSTHNMHACPHHLARIVREIDSLAAEYDIAAPESTPGGTDKRYRKFGTHPDDDGRRMTDRDANYARVTVKPHRFN